MTATQVVISTKMEQQRNDDDLCPSTLTPTITVTKSSEPSNDCDDDDDDDETSINSQEEALCEMLGLPSFTLTLQDDVDEDDDHAISSPSSNSMHDNGKNDHHYDASSRAISWIDLPPNASRYFYPPSECTAFCIPHLFTPAECQQWIDLGAQAPNNHKKQESGFQYITHATHTTSDGSTSFLVELQNPNPHKLSVFHHPSSVALIWNRLQDLIRLPIQKLINRESCGAPVGLNPRLRVLKYDAIDYDEFKPHFDATTQVGANEISLLTVLVYLNTGGGVDFAGGDTLYLNHGVDAAAANAAGATTTKTSTRNNDHHGHHHHHQNNNAKDGVVAVTPTVGSVVIFEHDLYHSSTPLEWGTKYVLRTDILFHLEHDPKEKQFQKERQQQQPSDDKEKATSLSLNNTDTTSSGATTSTSTTRPTTTCSTMRQLCEKLQMTSIDQEALDDLGMLEMSLEAFCGGPGKFALYQMLQSVGIPTSTCRTLIEGAFADINTLKDDDNNNNNGIHNKNNKAVV